MKLLKNVCLDYARGCVFFAIVFYFVTAKPDGTMPMRWNAINLWWTLSFVLAYPVLLETFPKMKRVNLHFQSWQSRSLHMGDQSTENKIALYHHSTNPIRNRIDLQAQGDYLNDYLNLALNCLLSGVLIAISVPGLGFVIANKLRSK
ncbi:hypothetical protein [Lactiplantibacillus modestisalitolerans]|uniref:Integral membrane protein n=1 Tax=Lactiplantibacillus modestisalitolerans TaxID=1457219 RepID=A0ABV5WWT3_9LACO|nr:hypothetical protein [Lactiplantibacillus modestisalitolerans]